MQKISQLTEALLRHTHIFSLIKSDHILFTELHTDKVVTSRKERKYSNDLMIWLWGMCSCSFLRGCFGQTGTSTAKNISEMNILTSCVCVESFIYRLWPEKSSSDPFHFPRSESHSASVPTVSQMSIYRSLWHKSPLLSKSTVCIIRQTSFPSSLWVQKTILVKIWGNMQNSDFQYEISFSWKHDLSLLAFVIKSSWAVLVASAWLNQSDWRSAVFFILETKCTHK